MELLRKSMMSISSASRGSSTKRQFEILFLYMKEHGDLNMKVGGNAAKDKWIELTRRLNCHGPKKHWYKWVELWSHCKNRARRKAMILNGNKGTTTILSLTECQLMIFLGHKIILDHHDDTLSQELQLKSFFNSPDKKAKVVAKTEPIQDEGIETAQGQPKTYWLRKIPTKSNEDGQNEIAYEDLNNEGLEEKDIGDVDIPKGTAKKLDRIRLKKTKKIVGKRKKMYHKIREIPQAKKYYAIDDVIDRFLEFENRNIDLQFLKAQNESRRLIEVQRQVELNGGGEFVEYMHSAIMSALIAYRNCTLSNR